MSPDEGKVYRMKAVVGVPSPSASQPGLTAPAALEQQWWVRRRPTFRRSRAGMTLRYVTVRRESVALSPDEREAALRSFQIYGQEARSNGSHLVPYSNSDASVVLNSETQACEAASMKSKLALKRILLLLLLVPPALLLHKLRTIPLNPIPISTSTQEAEIRGAEAAAAEYHRAD